MYGPSSLGAGVLDGIAFDAYGNLWGTMIFADALVAITPDGELLKLFEDGDRDATARFDAEFDAGRGNRPRDDGRNRRHGSRRG